MAVIGSTFSPLTRADVYKKDGYKETGEIKRKKTSRVGVSPIKLDIRSERTSIRTDTSGSGSQASVIFTQGRALVVPTADIEIGDSLIIFGIEWVIISVAPRYAMSGVVDHFQVDLENWT